MVDEHGAPAVSRDRDQRLQSAKKKLKNYRAKQAQMEKAKRMSTISNASSSHVSSSSTSISPSRLVGAVLNEAFEESQVAMARNSLRMSGSFDKRHSRTMSRSGAGHGRGHSRSGSISLSQSAFLGGVAAAAAAAQGDHLAQKGSISSSRPLSTHFANTTRSHTRGHSRSGSKSLAARSRPTSVVAIPTPDDHEHNHEHWNDADVSFSEDMLKTPTMDGQSMFQDRDATPQQKDIHQATSTIDTMATPSASSTAHARRPSRHARKGSVSTRRESMELMGGLVTLDSSNRQSRRISSHRWSGLQSASILFGGTPDIPTFDKQRDGDGDGSEDEGGDRLTALEKLEGKSRRTSQHSSVQLPSFDDVHGDEAMDKRASLHLLEANAQSTSSERSPGNVAHPVTIVDASSEEGLGTLMEEEEEEEEQSASSPVKERDGLDLIDEQEKRLRKEAEQEVIKRTRRSSLTPRPLKLKSRPLSLFVAPRSNRNPLPTMEQNDEEEDDAGASVESDVAAQNLVTPSSWSLASAQQKAKPVSPRDSTPSRETKRAWRSSMPVATPSPASNERTSLASASGSASVPRQGMRTLRLGTTLSPLMTSTSTPSSLRQQHKNHSDSVSSMTSSASNSSAAFSRRGSLLYNVSPIATLNTTSSAQEETSPLAKKRGSLLYKSSGLEGSSSASPVELSMSSSQPTLASPVIKSAPATGASAGKVPMGVFDELKSKHQRDIGLLGEARTKISRLEGEMSSEAERMGQEYAELERWSAEEKRSLGQRIEYLEASIIEVVEVRAAKERDYAAERQRAEEAQSVLRAEFEDVEAERDMLREDVEGWRTRCSDLEKTLRSERQTGEETKRYQAASKARIKELLKKLHDHKISVQRKSVDDDDPSSDLVAILRSPAMGPSSPLLGATRERSASPSHNDLHQMAPPQAVQLLKDMRQQIFNLAGSLEHERNQHLAVKKETEDLKAEVARLSTALHDHSLTDTTMTTTDSHFFSPEKVRSISVAPTASTPPQPSAHNDRRREEAGASGKKKRNHVFAYDSSMESGSGSTSVGGSVTTNQTSEPSELYHDHGEESEERKNDEEFVAQVEADLVGLGMGGLGTLAEEEEVASECDDGGKDLRPLTQVSQERSGRDSFDLESGRRASDDHSIAPSTPALEHNTSRGGQDPPPVPALPLEHAAMRGSSTSSSIESHGPPSPVARTAVSSQDTVTSPLGLSQEELYEDKVSSREPRPEFIREWSFERATAAVRATKNMTRPRVPAVTSARKPRNRNMSIEDFFGIMSLDESQKLPPLPTPEEALEMPPLFIEETHQPGSLWRSDLGYGALSRGTTTIRPPVGRGSMMYARSNASDRSSVSSRHSSNHQSSNQSHQSGPGTDVATAGGMLSRVVSLTSAFSGLSGYLTGSSNASGAGMAVHAAAAASKVCSADDDYDARNPSISWAVTRREEEMA